MLVVSRKCQENWHERGNQLLASNELLHFAARTKWFRLTEQYGLKINININGMQMLKLSRDDRVQANLKCPFVIREGLFLTGLTL